MDYLQYLTENILIMDTSLLSFKPYYKWITFNTYKINLSDLSDDVLNLIINGLPSIPQIFLFYTYISLKF